MLFRAQTTHVATTIKDTISLNDSALMSPTDHPLIWNGSTVQRDKAWALQSLPRHFFVFPRKFEKSRDLFPMARKIVSLFIRVHSCRGALYRRRRRRHRLLVLLALRTRSHGEAPSRSYHVPETARHCNRPSMLEMRRQVCHLRFICQAEYTGSHLRRMQLWQLPRTLCHLWWNGNF